MLIHNAVITGSLTLNGIDIGDITGSEASVAALNSFSASILSYTASNNTNISALQSATASLQTFSSSILTYTASNNTNINALQTFSSSILTYTASNDTTNNTQNSRLSSLEVTSGSLINASASFSTRVANTETTSSNLTIASASFSTRVANNEATGSSLVAASASFSTRVANTEATSSNLVAASASFSSSISSLQAVTGSYATTGSNTFVGANYFSNASNAISFTSTGSLYSDGGMRITKDMYVSGTAYFNNVTVYGTQSISYISSSQLNIGTNIISVNTDTPTIRFGGLSVYDSGSTGLTGSILWDSEANHWIYTNPSGSSYSGGMLISGPRNTSGIGNEVGTTCNAIMKGQGGDHITSSGIFDYGNATCFYGNSYISSSGNACFGGNTTIAGNLGVGTITPGQLIDVYKTSNDAVIRVTSCTAGAYIVADSCTDGYYGLILQSNSNQRWFIGGYTTADLTFRTSQTGGSEWLRISRTTGIACFTSTVCAPAIVFCSSVNSGYTPIKVCNPNPGSSAYAEILINNDTTNLAGLFYNSSTRSVDGGVCSLTLYNDSANGNLRLRTGNNLVLATGSPASDRLVINTNGCVGVNTTSPGFLLDLKMSGALRTDGLAIRRSTNDSHQLGLWTTGGEMYIDAVTDNVLAAGVLVFRRSLDTGANFSESMRFTSTGIACFSCQVCAPAFVGGTVSGTTGTFSGKLTVSQASTDFVAEFTNTANSTPYGLRVKDAGTPANNYPLLSVTNNAGSVEYFRVNSGTGMTTFTGVICSACRICSPSLTTGILRLSDEATYGLTICKGANSYPVIFADGAQSIGFITAQSGVSYGERLRISHTGEACFACTVCLPVAIVSGCVGIGTTSPSYKLDVDGIIRSKSGTTGTLYLGETSAGTTYVAAALIGTPSTTYNPVGRLSIQIPTHGIGTDYGLTEQMSIQVPGPDSKAATMVLLPFGGNVGIGLTTPQYALSIQRTGNVALHFSTNGCYTGECIDITGGGNCTVTDGNSAFRIRSVVTAPAGKATGNLGFWVNCGDKLVERMHIGCTGNVGIGTTSPAYKLDVGGNIKGGDYGAVPNSTWNGLTLSTTSLGGNTGNAGVYIYAPYDSDSNNSGFFRVKRGSGNTYNGTEIATSSTFRILTSTTEDTNERLRITSGGNVILWNNQTYLCYGVNSLQLGPIAFAHGQISINNQLNYAGNADAPVACYQAQSGCTGGTYINTYYSVNSDGLGSFPRWTDIVSVGSPDGGNGGSNIRFFTHGITCNVYAVERMRIASTGITCFACQICAKSLWFSSNTTGQITFGSNDACNAYVVSDSNNALYLGNNNSYKIFVPNDGADMIFRTSATYGNPFERMRINASGDLELKGRSTTTNYQAVFYNDNAQLAINATNTSTGKAINFNPSSTFNAFSIAGTGIACFACTVCAPSLQSTGLITGDISSFSHYQQKFNGNYYVGSVVIANNSSGGAGSNWVNLARVDDWSSANSRIIAKVTVLYISATSDQGNEHVGYALLNYAGTSYACPMTVSTGATFANSNVGTIRWCSGCLQYCAPSGAYFLGTIKTELATKDGASITLFCGINSY